MSESELREKEKANTHKGPAAQPSISDRLDEKYASPESVEKANVDQKTAAKVSTQDQTKSYDNDDEPSNFRFRDESKSKLKGFFRGKNSRNKAFAAGGLGATLLALLIASIISLLPAKIIHLVENLQRHFFATSESALENRSQYLLNRYLKKHVMAALRKPGCDVSTRIVDKSCVSLPDDVTPAGKLFRVWREQRLENTLANKYGFEISRTNNNGRDSYLIKLNGNNTNIDVTGWATSGDSNDNIFKRLATADRHDVRILLKQSYERETYMKRVFYRYKFGRFMERKYGIRRCLFFCGPKDKFDDWGDRKKNAFQLALIRRVVIPHTNYLGFALECIISNECQDSAEIEGDDNQRRDAFERKVQKLMADNALEMSKETAEKVIKLADEVLDLNKKGFAIYLADKIFGLFDKTLSDKWKSAIPFIGWVDTIARSVTMIKDAGPKLRRWAFVANAAAYISVYMMYRSYADEIKSGHVDQELVGSAFRTLSDTAGAEGHTNQPAEVSPLYTELLGSYGPQNNTSILSSLFPRTYAVAAQKIQYTCDDEQPIDPGRLVCPEENLIIENFATDLSDALNQPPLKVIGNIAASWTRLSNKIFGAVTNLIGSIFGKIIGAVEAIVPGAKQLIDAVSGAISDFLMIIIKWLIPSPVNDNMSGARAFNAMSGGADAAGNDNAHYNMGAKRVTDQVSARIRQERQIEYKQEFQTKSFFARIFDKEDSLSFVSQLALSMPSNTTYTAQLNLSNIVNPLNSIAVGLTSLLPGRQQVSAATINDPFGIPQYAYDMQDPEVVAAVNTDPDKFTDQYCKVLNQEWAEGTGRYKDTLKIDKATGMDIHTKVNPCLLEKVVTGSAGGYFDTDVLDSQDLGTVLGDTSSGIISGSSGGSGLVSPTGYSFPLAPQTKAVSGITVGQTVTTHHDGTPAFDLFSTDSADVYAIFGGTATKINTNFQGVPGCTSIQFKADDGYYYWHGHLKNPTISVGQHVAAGTKIAEVADNRNFDGSCYGGGPHLHIDRGCVINGRPQEGGRDACRDPDFIPFLSKLYETLP